MLSYLLTTLTYFAAVSYGSLEFKVSHDGGKTYEIATVSVYDWQVLQDRDRIPTDSPLFVGEMLKCERRDARRFNGVWPASWRKF